MLLEIKILIKEIEFQNLLGKVKLKSLQKNKKLINNVEKEILLRGNLSNDLRTTILNAKRVHCHLEILRNYQKFPKLKLYLNLNSN
jgi:hypothetical protein